MYARGQFLKFVVRGFNFYHRTWRELLEEFDEISKFQKGFIISGC